MMILLTDVLMGALLVAVNHFYDFIPDTLTMRDAWVLLLKYVVSSLSAAGMALIPLFFGMRKHSVTTTLVSSILLVMVVCSGFNGPAFSINTIIVIPLTLGAIGIWVASLSMFSLETKDMN
jgi:hypothetical protein